MDSLESSLVAIQKIRAELPETVNAYLNYSTKVKSGEELSDKQKALILVSLSLFAQCESCILMNVGIAIETQATRVEILEVAMLSVSMGGVVQK
jgi:alkylhydroperoxidase/carboxymuconolactone decarboxylase family protein YurZ